MVTEGGHHAQVSFPHPISNQDHHWDGFPTYILAIAGDKFYSGLPTHCRGCYVGKKPLQNNPESESAKEWKFLN